MSDESPKKPFVQVPSSSPIGPSSNEASPVRRNVNNMPPTRSLIDQGASESSGDYQILSKPRFGNGTEPPGRLASLKENFAYSPGASPAPIPPVNGASDDSAIAKRLADDIMILKKKYPTLKESIMTQTWKRKKGNLRQVIEFLNSLQKTHPHFFQSKPEQLSASLVAPSPIYLSSSSGSPSSLRLNSLSDSTGLRTANLNPVRKKLSIQQKFGIERKVPSLVQEQPKRRKLVRGSRNPKPEYNEDNMASFIDDSEAASKDPIPASLKVAAKPLIPPSKAISLSDEEEDEANVGESDDSDSDAEDYKTINSSAQFQWDQRVLGFLNTAELGDICDIGGCTPAIAEQLISERPFDSLYQVEKKDFTGTKQTDLKKGGRRGIKKTNGLKIIEKASLTLKGYDAVDSLVQQCSEYGTTISNEISKWGISVIGEKGELEVVDIDTKKVDKDAFEDDEEGGIKAHVKHAKGTYFTHKPTLLAESLELKSYQQVGINWLNLLYQNNLSCILADEMGLGKTCQVISFFAYLKEIGVDEGPHLVVVPSSTLENWLREFQKFCPQLKVSPYYGTQLERYDLRIDLANTDFDILVTTYNLTTGHKDDFKFLKSQGFNVVVYDEGHMLKNSNSERYTKLMKLKAKFRLLLTGTPLQNNLKELISLLAFIMPDLFREKKEDLQVLFNQKVKTSSNESEGGKNYNPLLSVRAISRAKTMMTPFVLRRKKLQVLKNLPEKQTFIEYCESTPVQDTLYKEQVALGHKLKSSGSGESINIIMKLRKAAIHPLLFRNHYKDALLSKMATDIMKEPVYRDANKEFIFEDMQVMTDFELNNLCLKFKNTIGKYKLDLSDQILSSGKFLKLQELLPKFIVQGDRILVFSLFTQVLDILEVLLTELSISFLRLDGQTSVELRQDIIDQFHNDESIKVFILSTKAGGFGINLACANTVIILDQSFNPHDDRQAEDRAHRVGQTRDVRVYRLITKNTIEENIYTLAQNKLALDKSVSSDSTESANGENNNPNEEKVSKSLFKELFST